MEERVSIYTLVTTELVRVSLAATYFDEVLENEINGFVFDAERGRPDAR